jgi:hypothetical protein
MDVGEKDPGKGNNQKKESDLSFHQAKVKNSLT